MLNLNKQEILQVRRLPARMDAAQTAVLLGFQEHDIPILMRDKLLNPLGSPKPNAPKYFSTYEIQMKAEDEKWLSKATRAISQYWLVKNQRKFPNSGEI